ETDPEPRLALDTAEIPIVAPPARPAPAPTTAPQTGVFVQTAGIGARLAAAALDLTLLGGLDLLVLYFTLKILDLNFAEVLLLPAAPLLSFLALLDGGYLAIFVAAGGQTIGKMAANIRVVPADPAAPASERVTLGHAIVRAVAFFISLLPAGLGLLPALFGEHRGLHDRLADTRVVKA
ncbi:MAG TPA: RDD family protein, partial [Vicinamibacterales bacterium]|nr:RDD family protein [Vicinamibacterales bacterium]